MVKGGLKRKIEIKPIEKKSSLGPICTKRREGLYSKASQLCLLSGSQIAILATPPSSESNVSFYSFGHSSVDGVVSAFLSGQRPVPVVDDKREMREDVGICLNRKNLGLGYWWENESLARSENPQEISEAIDSMWSLLRNLKELRAEDAAVNDCEDLKNNEKSVVVLDHATQEPDQTPNLQSAICCLPGDLPDTFNEITEEQDQILPICENFFATGNNNNNALTEVNLNNGQEMDIDQLIDFDSPFESSLDVWFSDNTHQEHQEETTASILKNSEAVYDHVSVKTTNLTLSSDHSSEMFRDEDDLPFSDFYNELTTTTAAFDDNLCSSLHFPDFNF